MAGEEGVGSAGNGAGNGGGKPILEPDAWEDEPTNSGRGERQREAEEEQATRAAGAAVKGIDDVVSGISGTSEEEMRERLEALNRDGFSTGTFAGAQSELYRQLTKLSEEDLSAFYSRPEKVILAVTGVFTQDIGPKVRRAINNSVRKSYCLRLYESIKKVETQYKTEFETKQGEYTSVEPRIADARNIIDETEPKCGEAESLADILMGQLEKLQKDLSEAEDKADYDAAKTYRAGISEKRKTVESLTRRITEAEFTMQDAEAESVHYEAKMEQLRYEINRSQQHYLKCKSDRRALERVMESGDYKSLDEVRRTMEQSTQALYEQAQKVLGAAQKDRDDQLLKRPALGVPSSAIYGSVGSDVLREGYDSMKTMRAESRAHRRNIH